MEKKQSEKNTDKKVEKEIKADVSQDEKSLKEMENISDDRKSTAKAFNIDYNVVMTVLVVIFLVLVVFNSFTIMGINKQLAVVQEQVKPASIELITITDKNCPDCFSLASTIDSIKKTNVEVKGEKNIDISSPEATDLISKYSIQKIPTVIVTGEIDKVGFSSLEKKEDAYILTQLTPPYTDAVTKKIEGLVTLTIIQPDCEKCAPVDPIVSAFKESGVKITKEVTLDSNDAQAKELIKNYGIEKIPTIILSNDLSVYAVADQFAEVGKVNEDGTYLLTTIAPPFYDVKDRKVHGLVTVTYINDSSCTECYNVMLHKGIVSRFGIVIDKEEVKDVSQVSSLLSKYNISKVPTILLSEDAKYYPTFLQVWNGVGTVEDDGTFVFNNIKALQGAIYKDLTTGQLEGQVQPTATVS